MGQQPSQDLVFVAGVGAVPRAQADQIRQSRAAMGPSLSRSLTLDSPLDKDHPTNLPPGDPHDVSSRIMDALPEIAGLGASLYPPTKGMGLVAKIAQRMLLPGAAAGVAEGGRELIEGEHVDPSAMLERGVTNALPGVIPGVGDMMGAGGKALIRSSLAAGRSTTAARGVTGAAQKTQELTLPVLNRLAETAKQFGASISPQGVEKLMATSVQLENASLKATGPALKALQQKIAALDQLIPEVRAVVDRSARGGAQTPRFAAGAGITRGLVTPFLVGGGSYAAGMDPQTAAMLGLTAGLPVGLAEASPRIRMAMGRGLAKGPDLAGGLETFIRALLAGNAATDPATAGSGGR